MKQKAPRQPASKKTNMKRQKVINFLKSYNKWRQYKGDIDKSPPQPSPVDISNAIDAAIDFLKADD